MPVRKFGQFLTPLFSQVFFKKIIAGGYHEPLEQLSGILPNFQKTKSFYSLGELLADVYDHFNRLYRCEYFYKNTIANELILKRSSPSSYGLLTEFKSGNGWVDLVIVNGCTSAYEIKTELDSLSRLGKQLEVNKKMFEKNYVVTNEKMLDKVFKITDESIGVMLLDKNAKIATVREATSDLALFDSSTVFDSLRRSEYLQILEEELGFANELPNTKIYTVCKNLFLTLNKQTVLTHFNRILKERSCTEQISKNVNRAPRHLKLIFLSSSYKESQFQTINNTLASRFQ